jgi:DNA-binding CsgD family transcriptional regulator
MSPSEQLNRTEVRVATRVWQGQTNPEIAVAFGTSEQVIKNHLRSIFDKLGVWSRLELALYVASHGGADWDGPVREEVVPIGGSDIALYGAPTDEATAPG